MRKPRRIRDASGCNSELVAADLFDLCNLRDRVTAAARQSSGFRAPVRSKRLHAELDPVVHAKHETYVVKLQYK